MRWNFSIVVSAALPVAASAPAFARGGGGHRVFGGGSAGRGQFAGGAAMATTPTSMLPRKSATECWIRSSRASAVAINASVRKRSQFLPRGTARYGERLLADVRQWLDSRLLGRRFGLFTLCGIAPSPCCERRRTNPRAERTKAGLVA
jgi:hypothetical protein